MYGVPRVLNTRKDFEMVHDMAVAGECDCEVSLSQWQGLLNGRYGYDVDRVLDEGEDPDGAEPDYRVMEEEDDAGDVQRVQYRRNHRENARIYRLGFTAEEVEAKIAELEEVMA